MKMKTKTIKIFVSVAVLVTFLLLGSLVNLMNRTIQSNNEQSELLHIAIVSDNLSTLIDPIPVNAYIENQHESNDPIEIEPGVWQLNVKISDRFPRWTEFRPCGE